MEVIRGLHNLREEHRGTVATIGNFDGVHLGHRAILEQCHAEAARSGLPVTVVVFEPQPREYFAGDQAPPRLTRVEPVVGPVGLVTLPLGYAAWYQSAVHSQTLPCMSKKPHGFAAY